MTVSRDAAATRIASFKFPSCTVTVSNGTLNGTVTDAATTLPISGVVVQANGYSATTNGSGAYSMSVPAGSYTVSAFKAGYGPASVSGVSSPSSQSVSSTSTAHAAGPCTLPHFGNLIEWLHEPGKPDRAVRVSDIDAATCQPTLNNWTANLIEAPGVCYMIGWDSANPGYNNMAVPAPRLPKAMDTIGDGC